VSVVIWCSPMSQLAYSFSQEEARLLRSDAFRACVDDDQFVDGIVFEIGQTDKGGRFTPIQFGLRLPTLIDSLRHLAEVTVDESEADVAMDLANKLEKQP
jgi:hypothetical protein